MTDNTLKKPQDLTKINVSHLGELLWWSYYFGTSPENLLSLVQKFGPEVKEIKMHIKK
ncbi:MAG: DUF3606 domain-containing protein [Bacteroidota bacterium]